MNYGTIILVTITFIFSACGEADQSSGSNRMASKNSTGKKLKDTSTEELSAERKEKDEKKEKEEEEEDIDQEDNEDAKIKKKDKKKEEEKKAKELEKKLTPMTVTNKRSEDDGLVLKVKNAEGKWNSVPWPVKGSSSTSESICGAKEVTVEIQIEHSGIGTVTANSHIGVRSKQKDSIEIGYEVDGSCNGAGCQDDNIVVLSCPNGISVMVK